MGKIHRVTDDGKPAPGNPFLNTPGADPTIWSYGHRNPEGLAFNPVDGHLWETEHGPTGGDEVNVIMGGKNYGWGVISRGLEPGINEIAHDGMEQPKTFFNPAIGPGGITFYTGNKYRGWKNDLFITGMVGQKLIRMEVKDDKILSQETLLDQVGRVRDVMQGPDGLLISCYRIPTGTPASTGIAAGDAGMVVRLGRSKADENAQSPDHYGTDRGACRCDRGSGPERRSGCPGRATAAFYAVQYCLHRWRRAAGQIFPDQHGAADFAAAGLGQRTGNGPVLCADRA